MLWDHPFVPRSGTSHLPAELFPRIWSDGRIKIGQKMGKKKKIKTEVKERLSREGKRSKEAAGMGFGRR